MTDLVLSFSPAGDAFAIATADGRIRTYDTGRQNDNIDLSSICRYVICER